MPRALALLGFAFLIARLSLPATAQVAAPRTDYRVVFASARQLERQLNLAASEGFSCVAVARPESDVVAPGVAVILGRESGTTPGVEHRVVSGGWTGAGLQESLNSAGMDGFRLCGLVLDEALPQPALVAVMNRRNDGSPVPQRFGVEVLSNYKASLARLNAAGRDGFVPAAAAPMANNRLRELRNWMVVAERAADGRSAVEVVVRSSSGPDGLQRALQEQGAEGYQLRLSWKEGHDFVGMMVRASPPPLGAPRYGVDTTTPGELRVVSHKYIADFPYLTGRRVVISDLAVSASNDVVEDVLPPIGALGYAEAGPLRVMSDHIGRSRDERLGSVSIRRNERNQLTLRTVLTRAVP